MVPSSMAWSTRPGIDVQQCATSARLRTSRSVVRNSAQLVIGAAIVWLVMPLRCAGCATGRSRMNPDAGGAPGCRPMLAHPIIGCG